MLLNYIYNQSDYSSDELLEVVIACGFWFLFLDFAAKRPVSVTVRVSRFDSVA